MAVVKNKYINIFYGDTVDDVTAQNVDGTPVSNDKSYVSPLSATLNAAALDYKIIKCAIRTEPNYRTVDDTVLTFNGTVKNKWQIAADDNYETTAIAAARCDWQDSLTIKNQITSINTIFWLKAKTDGTEEPFIDRETFLNVKSTIEIIV